MDFFNLRSLVFLLSIFGCCFGNNILPEGPVDGVLGKHVTFKTNVEPADFLAITWAFNTGEELETVVTKVPGAINPGDGYDKRVALNVTNGELKLGPLTAEDSGDYTLSIITTKAETLLGETTLRVLEAVSDVTITSNMAEAVETNSTVVLSCSAKGSFLKYAWLNGSAPLMGDGKHVTLSNENMNVTVAGVLRGELAGPIFCVAGNKLEKEKSAPFNLTVSYGPENIAMTIAPTTKVILKGSNITLTCSAQSSPAATFQWIHNGVARKETTPKLVLANVDETQAGNITCMASNAKTKRYVAAKLVSFSVMEAISVPQVTGPTGTLVAGNSTASLSCTAKARTISGRVWTKDGKPLAASDRVKLSADNSLVTISPVQKEDNGEYKCQLSNDVSAVAASHKLVVNYGPEAVAVTGEDAVEVTDPVKLMCTSVSLPAPTYTWRFNGTLTKVTTAEYLIEKAVYKDTGVYTCQATNAVTGLSNSITHTLSVKEEGALDEGLSDGAIAGIIIGVLLAVAIIVGVVFYMRQKQPVASPY